MAKKKQEEQNNFVMERVVEAINAAFFHGMAAQRLQDANFAAHGAAEAVQQAVAAVNEVIMVPDKKEMN